MVKLGEKAQESLHKILLKAPGDPVIPKHEVGVHREARGYHGCSSIPQSSFEGG